MSYISEDRTIPTIRKAKDIAEMSHVEFPPDIFDIDSSNVEDIFNCIQKGSHDIKFVIECINFAALIRPKQIESISLLFKKVCEANQFTPEKGLVDFFNSNVNCLTFEDGTIEKVIIDDNIDKFIEITSNPSFNERNSIKENRVFRMMLEERSFTCMQLMALYGSLKCFKYALLDGSFNTCNISKFAIAGGNVEIIHLLEQKGERFDDCFDVSAIFNRDNISDWLLANYKCENIVLWKSVEYFNLGAFFFILKNNNQLTEDDLINALKAAVDIENLSLVKYIFEECIANIYESRKICLNTLPKGEFALQVACENENLEILKYLVETCHIKFNDGNIYDGSDEIKEYLNEKSLLHKEINIGNLVSVKELFEKGNFYIDQEYNGNTVLQLAFKKGDLSIVKYLVEECNASLNKGDIFSDICKEGNLTILKYMIEEKKIVCIDNKSAFNNACGSGNFELVKYLIDNNLSYLNDTESDRGIILKNACKSGNLELVKYLIEEWNLNTTNLDVYKRSALHYACSTNNLELVKYLIEERHENPNETSLKMETPINIACKTGKYEIFKYLIEKHHVNLYIKTLDNGTLIKAAIDGENLDIVKYLVEVRHCLSYDDFGWACCCKNLNIVKYLNEECSSDFIKEKKFVFNQLASACKNGRFETAKYLIEKYNKNINQNMNEKTKNLILYDAINGRNLKLVKYLMDELHITLNKNDKRIIIAGRRYPHRKEFKAFIRNL